MATKSTAAKLTFKITSFIMRLLLNIIFYIIVVILIINFSKKAFEFTYQLYGPDAVDAAPGREIIIEINKGESSMDIASKLELNRAIENKYSFYLKTKLSESVIMPGTYKINSSMTYDEILTVITDYSASLVQDKSAAEAETKTDTETKAKTEAKGSAEKGTEKTAN